MHTCAAWQCICSPNATIAFRPFSQRKSCTLSYTKSYSNSKVISRIQVGNLVHGLGISVLSRMIVCQGSGPDVSEPVFIRQEHSRAGLANALQRLEGYLEIPYVKDWKLQMYVAYKQIL